MRRKALPQPIPKAPATDLDLLEVHVVIDVGVIQIDAVVRDVDRDGNPSKRFAVPAESQNRTPEQQAIVDAFLDLVLTDAADYRAKQGSKLP